jgi:hypothetical protein
LSPTVFTLWLDEAALPLFTAEKRSSPAFNLVVQGRDFSDPNTSWAARTGLEETGALLVRPDGHIAWRCEALPKNPSACTEERIDEILTAMPAPIESENKE